MNADIRNFSWHKHFLGLLPLLLAIGLVFALLGNEDGVEEYFLQLRVAHPGFTRAIDSFTDYGNFGYYGVYIFLLVSGIRARRKSDRNFALAYVGGLIITLLCVEMLKYTVGRARPPVDGDFMPFSSGRSYQSFPSGHVTETLVTALPLSQRYGRRLLPLLLGVSPVLMALSRLYLGQHHPSDFAGSVMVGSFGIYLVMRLFNYLDSAKTRPRNPSAWLAHQERCEAM